MDMRAYLWVGILCIFTSCVDDKYDLDKVDTDNVTLGDEWVIPLGTLDVKVTDVINLDPREIDGLKVATNGDYSISYEKEATVSFPNLSLRPFGDKVDIARFIPSADFEMNNLKKLMGDFGSEFKLGLVNPYITLVAGGLEGNGTVNAILRMTASQFDQASVITDSPFFLSKDRSKVWIGSWPTTDPSYEYVENKELPNLIADLPDKVTVQATQFLIPVGGITNLESLTYVMELPFVPSEIFRATATQRMKDIFDEDFIQYVFSSGTTTIFGTVNNQLPIDAEVIMSITDATGNSLLKLPAQMVAGYGSQPVSFKIEEKDMPQMRNARNIDLQFNLSGRRQNLTQEMGKGYLNKNQALRMDLKLRKTGGINVTL